MSYITPMAKRKGLKLWGSPNEVFLVLAIVVLSLIIGLANPVFFSIATPFDLVRSSLIEVLFGLGLLIVLVSGGIDISFPIVGIFAGYTSVVIMQTYNLDTYSLWIPLVLAAIVGAILGSINALLIAGFGLPTLIATLGTAGMFRGFLLTYVGSAFLANIPLGLDQFATADLFSVETAQGTLARLHVLIIPVLILAVAIAFLMRRTMFGRTIFAIGGNEESARRMGMNVRWAKAQIYILVGTLSGIAGILFISLQRKADPYDLAGSELEIIAAVVLGGASIMGGYGTVTGTILGVLLINLIKDNLILLGVPGSWQRAAIGLMLLIGVASQAISDKRRMKQAVTVSEEKA
ncbi:MAG: ABC transporter permease [Microbacteriaceae bacterium]|tara:strand:+ start:5772 stop:6818 length:1047 start_codon:yes stop_codon:yes gene_type:complete